MQISTFTKLATVALTIFGAGCATNTMTGRSQLSIMSEDSVSKQSVSSYASMMGSLSKKNQLIEGKPINDRINGITNRLIQQAIMYNPNSAQWDWKVSIIDDDKTINAFCMPGGLMAIYTGMINQLNITDDEIAAVMGHEIGHALAGHGAEKMSTQMATNAGALILSALISKDSRDFKGNNEALTFGALASVNLPNGRLTEVEADKIGIELAARAGYDPVASVSLWEKMAKVTKSKGKADFFSTHPAPERRQENLRALGEVMLPLYAAGKTAPAPYDWLNGDKSKRPYFAQSDAIAFYSEAWESFKDGSISLNGDNQASMVLKQKELAKAYREKRWRDLAMGVYSSNYKWDLGYFYLYKSAAAMGYKDAANFYEVEARKLAADDDMACAKKRFLSCGEIDVLGELKIVVN